MKTIGAAKFKEQCLALLDRLDMEGLVVTTGRPLDQCRHLYRGDRLTDQAGAGQIGRVEEARLTCLERVARIAAPAA